MHLINFEITESIKALEVKIDRILLPDLSEVKIELKLSEKPRLIYASLGQPFLRLTYDIDDMQYDIINFAFISRRSAQDAKRYFESHLSEGVTDKMTFPIPFEGLEFIEHEKFEDFGEAEPLHEVTHYDLSAKKRYLTDEPMCTSKANRTFEFNHQYQIN